LKRVLVVEALRDGGGGREDLSPFFKPAPLFKDSFSPPKLWHRDWRPCIRPFVFPSPRPQGPPRGLPSRSPRPPLPRTPRGPPPAPRTSHRRRRCCTGPAAGAGSSGVGSGWAGSGHFEDLVELAIRGHLWTGRAQGPGGRSADSASDGIGGFGFVLGRRPWPRPSPHSSRAPCPRPFASSSSMILPRGWWITTTAVGPPIHLRCFLRCGENPTPLYTHTLYLPSPVALCSLPFPDSSHSPPPGPRRVTPHPGASAAVPLPRRHRHRLRGQGAARVG